MLQPLLLALLAFPVCQEACVDSVAVAQAEKQELVGLAWAVVRAGEPLHRGAFGLADRERARPIDESTLFRWASISKPLTAIAAMQLVQAGRLDLERDVREYVPEFPEKPQPINARQLLAHQGGIVHYTNGPVIRTEVEYESEHPFEDVILALDTFKESPLVAKPGTAYAYTTRGYILLGAVVQRAGKAPYWEQVKERIAKPLGMQSLRPDYPWTRTPERARGYRRVLGVIVPSTDTDVSWKLPGGGFTSNVTDLARFAEGLLGEKLVQPKTRERMWTRQPLPEGKTSSYGLGFFVGKAHGQRLISHSGGQEATRTLMRLFPDRGTAVVLMSNCEYANLKPIALAMEKVLFE
jgi:CubicO group peptidase (beta-lactamase class C family)